MAFNFETRIPDTGFPAMVKGATHGVIIPAVIYLWLLLVVQLEDKLVLDGVMAYWIFAAVMYEVLPGKEEARKHFSLFAILMMMVLVVVTAMTGGFGGGL